MNQPPPPPPPPPTGPPSGDIQTYHPGMPLPQKTNGMSIASLVSGILGLTMCPGLGSVLALAFGYIARSQIKRSEGREAGNGMAIAGIVMGWIGVALTLLTIAAIAMGAFAVFNSTG